MPTISIIVPVYNAEKYLKRCIDSILVQSFSDFELILVNDGSNDNSECICKEYLLIDNRIKLFNISNRGASLARKYGLDKSEGEYISFVDADDFIDKEYINTLYLSLLKHQVRISACNVLRVNIGQVIKSNNALESSLLKFQQLMPRFFKYEFWGLPGKLYKKHIFDYVNFPIATLSEDYYITAQLFLLEQSMVYSATSMYFYEFHAESLSHTKLSNRAFEEFDNVKAVYELIKKDAPQYADMALSNVVETSIKLLSMSKKTDKKLFYEKRKELQTFIRLHFFKIMLSKSIYWKYKILVLKWVSIHL